MREVAVRRRKAQSVFGSIDAYVESSFADGNSESSLVLLDHVIDGSDKAADSLAKHAECTAFFLPWKVG